jgi:hypothetical protein
MARHRITLVRDDAEWPDSYSNEDWIAERRRAAGFTIESVEKLPDPPIVKKFEVEIEFPADHPPARHMDYARAIRLSIVDPAAGPVTTSPDRTVTVKEIS